MSYKNIAEIAKLPGIEEKRLANLRKTISEGRRKPRDPEELKATAKKMMEARARMTPDQIAAGNKKRADARRGKPGMGKSAKGIGNARSLWWMFKAANGTRIHGVNLQEMILANSHLFLPEDLIQRWRGRCSTRAYGGLRSLFKSKRAPVSWKGWTAIAQVAADDTEAQARFLREPKI